MSKGVPHGVLFTARLDTVNVVSRIEQRSESNGLQPLVSDAVWKALESVPGSPQSLGLNPVKGYYEAPIEVFRVA